MIDRFALAFREQQQLFLFDKAYIGSTLFKVGGLSTLCSRFFVQFFRSPAAAVAITVALLILGAWMLWASLRSSRNDWAIIPLCAIPFAFLAASISENSMHLSVLTAALIAVAALWIYSGIRSHRVLWGIVLTAGAYLLAGPAALVFAICATIVSLFRKEWTSLIYLPVGLLCGLGAFLSAWVPTLLAAWTPSFYYDLDAAMPVAHWTPWILLPACTLACEAVKHIKTKPILIFGVCAALALISLIPAFKMARKAEKGQAGLTYEYEYYTANEDWDGLLASCLSHEWIPYTVQYLNLALSWKGTLAEDMFKYDQRGPSGLVMMGGERGIEPSQAHIMFAMGNMAAAQDVAFNTLNSTEGLCPAMLKMNAQIELMRGAYGVADKYLSILEKAPFYRKWARAHKAFLNDDAAVEDDPVLGNGRRSWPTVDGFAMFGSPMEELSRVIDANPANKQAIDYALAYMLLAKDVENVTAFVSRYFGQPGLQTLPTPAQEAVLFFCEYARNVEGVAAPDEQWCRSHGVTAQTIQRFKKFQDDSLKSNGKAPNGYRSTYWYYLLYKQI